MYDFFEVDKWMDVFGVEEEEKQERNDDFIVRLFLFSFLEMKV